MHCPSLDENDRLTSLAAGELPWWEAWSLRRHLRACPDCRARWEQTQGLWTGLRALASAPAPDALRSRVFAVLPPASPPQRRQTRTITIGGIAMNRRTLAVTSAALLLIVTGTVAGRLVARHTNKEFSRFDGIDDLQGHKWHFTSNFQGNLALFNSQGQAIGLYRMATGDANGDVNVTVQGWHVSGHSDLLGQGRHDIRSTQGDLLGYAVLGPLSPQDVAEIKQEGQHQYDYELADFDEAARSERRRLLDGGGEMGSLDATPVYAAEYNPYQNAFWMMRGVGLVGEIMPGDDKVSSTLQNFPASTGYINDRQWQNLIPLTSEQLRTPQFVFMVGDTITHEQGYGTHVIRDASGNTLMTLRVVPPTPEYTSQPLRPARHQ